ncbi:MAG: hypothetical protein LPD71_08835 [Shewanella sp.]|nr:hypothetical protein [Shewanella sp.]MCF1432184.1 hypothetical protein [Shewanella sp.]MCF1438832.1 hypothetical protein [Shewanella sp.]MCF1457253.1 hypothetical protein [Shewanella sp.]
MKKALVLLIGLLVLGACTQGGKWSLIYQPDIQPGEDLIQVESLKIDAINGYYDTLEQCRLKGEGMRRLAGDKGDYICGFQCQTDQQGMLHCQDLSR